MPESDSTTGQADDVAEAENNTNREEESRVKQGTLQVSKNEAPEADEFGLPVRTARNLQYEEEDNDSEEGDIFEDAVNGSIEHEHKIAHANGVPDPPEIEANSEVDVRRVPPIETTGNNQDRRVMDATSNKPSVSSNVAVSTSQAENPEHSESPESLKSPQNPQSPQSPQSPKSPKVIRQRTASSTSGRGVSEWSHQQLAPQEELVEEEEDDEDNWQVMPAYATHRIYDDWGKVLAKEYNEAEDESFSYGSLGGAGKGYTRVQVDDDAQSATSMDDNTAYLFKDHLASNALLEDDEEARDLESQMQTTKELLTEGQRIAYVGLVRLSVNKVLSPLDSLERTKATKRQIDYATEATKMWGQKTMVRLYAHMEIDSQEQVMVEQLAEHGVIPSDLTPALMQNARVKNPTANGDAKSNEPDASTVSSTRQSTSSFRQSNVAETEGSVEIGSHPQTLDEPSASQPVETLPATSSTEQLPAYQEHTADDLTVENPADLEKKKDLDIDIRWTILCDLFLLLIADSTYDSRSRVLLEHVGASLSVDWLEICRFEKRVTDALEMQEQADRENWNEEEYLEARRKAAKKKRMMVMGLCTVGGGLVIGLSAGLLAPVIGAGLAAGFATFGVAGTGTFLGGAGAATLIGTAGAATGGIIGVRASNRRTGAVKTFEYRPLFNNKRPNLIVSVSGWMTGKVDDVRLPFSTIDPIMGDIYSVNWEPEMLQSTGQTIQILATEALTQTIQQILGSTILTMLMAGLSVPIVLTKLSYLIDNPWTVSLARADATGLILADSLIDRNLGVRPITLVGFSLGSRVIFSALKELARRGAIGLIQNVYMFGSPVVFKKEDYIRARTVVSGRFVNGYATNDWILGYLFRATSGGIMRVSGLASVNVPGIENKDVTEIVPGHMAYRGMMPTLLMEVGWAVENAEFTEIEDPDPENHEKRQRELISEIEAARSELEEKKKHSRIRSFFSRKKVVKKEWETYDERSQKVLEGDDKAAEELALENSTEGKTNVMFDVDAIRREALALAMQGGDLEEIKQHIQIREIESTLPALKVSTTISANDGQKAVLSDVTTVTHLTNGNAHISSVDASADNSTKTSSDEQDFKGTISTLPHAPIGERPGTAPSTNTVDRPPLRSAMSAPMDVSTVPDYHSVGHVMETVQRPHEEENAWANEGEGEVSMSFE